MIKIEQLRQLQQQNRTRPQSPVAVPKQEALSPADPLKPEDTSTDGPLNGQLWRLISPEAKAAFILGFSEALWVEKGEAKSKYFPLRLQADELSAYLDRFYENPENIIIPVFAALEVITLRSNGTDPQALEVRLSVYRRLAHLSAEELQKLIKGN